MDQTSQATNTAPQEEPLVCIPQDTYEKKNYYAYARHILLFAAILFSLSVIFFLIYQNGKSIYDNGI